jgi:hypothetical protein
MSKGDLQVLSERHSRNTVHRPHPVSVTSHGNKRPKWTQSAALLITAGSAAAYAHQWQTAAMLIGFGVLLLGWYVGLLKTHQCGGFAPTTDDRVCANAPRGGLLRGCHLHRWWRIERLLGNRPDE